MPYADPARQREYVRQWIARRRADWMRGKTCVDCGGTRDLEVDHVDPRTKVSHRVWSWASERRDAELAKCVVRCHECHVAKSIRDGDNRHGIQRPMRHGDRGMYIVRKCRCYVCRAASAQRRRQERIRTKQLCEERAANEAPRP